MKIPTSKPDSSPRVVDASTVEKHTQVQAQALCSPAVPLNPAPSGPTKSGPTAPELAKLVVRKAELALAYSGRGLGRLANRRLGEAEAAFAQLSGLVKETAQGPHLGLTSKGQGASREAAREKLREARESLAAQRGQLMPPSGPPPWKKTVLLFGSSANPPTGHSGHAGIVSWGARHKVDIANDEAMDQAREQVPIDEVWVLPVYRHLFASKSNLLPFEQRFEMAELAFSNLPGLEGRVRVQDTERELVEQALAVAKAKGQPLEQVRVGTIDIVRHLEAAHPGTKFVLALGADTHQDLLDGKWKEGDKLMASTEIVVVPRAGVSSTPGQAEDAPKLGEVSSTAVRGSTDLDYLSNPDILHPKVLEYMRKNQLYGFAKET